MPETRKPCPCGSGKPDGECCGSPGVLYSLERVRWRRAGQNLRRSLGEYADQPSFAWDAARAQDLYLGCLNRQFVDRDDDFTMERCFEWFIFDYKLSSGRTVIESFREEYSATLNDYEATLVREWARSRISLYEVTGVLSGEGLEIKDLFNNKTYRVHDVSAAAEIDAGSILLMRVLKVGEEYEFSTSGLALPGNCREPLLSWLSRDREDFLRGKKAGNTGWVSYLKERAHMVNARVMEFSLSGTEPGSQAGRERTECRTILAVEDFAKAQKYLKKSEAVKLIRELKDRSGDVRQVTAALLGLARRKGGAEEAGHGPAGVKGRAAQARQAGLREVIGHLILTPRFMIITASSPALLSECEMLSANLLYNHSTAGEVSSALSDLQPKTPEGEGYSWPEPGYAAVAGTVREGLAALGYNPVQQKGALRLWFDFCSKERPAIRKTAVWAATVIYAFCRVEMEERPKQQELAGRYGVASSTISTKFRIICQSLDLVAYDKRYSTKRPPLAGAGEGKQPFTRLL